MTEGAPPFIGKINLSRHARRRFKERTGLPTRALAVAARKAVEEGKSLGELPDPIREGVQANMTRHEKGSVIQIFKFYEGHGFVFALNPNGTFVLVTVLPYLETSPDDYRPHRRSHTAPAAASKRHRQGGVDRYYGGKRRNRARPKRTSRQRNG